MSALLAWRVVCEAICLCADWICYAWQYMRQIWTPRVHMPAQQNTHAVPHAAATEHTLPTIREIRNALPVIAPVCIYDTWAEKAKIAYNRGLRMPTYAAQLPLLNINTNIFPNLRRKNGWHIYSGTAPSRMETYGLFWVGELVQANFQRRKWKKPRMCKVMSTGVSLSDIRMQYMVDITPTTQRDVYRHCVMQELVAGSYAPSVKDNNYTYYVDGLLTVYDVRRTVVSGVSVPYPQGRLVAIRIAHVSRLRNTI